MDGDKHEVDLDFICLPDIVFLACNTSFQELLLRNLFVEDDDDDDDDEVLFVNCLFIIGDGEVNRDFLKCLDEVALVSFV